MKYVILSGWTQLKLPIISKNCSNKSCSKLNFVQESQWAYMSISPRKGGRGLERLPSLRHYNALKQNGTLTSELNAAKNTHYIKKCFKMKVIEYWISYKKVGWRTCLSPRGMELVCSKDLYVTIVLKQESRYTLGLKTAEIIDYIRECFK